MNPMIPKKKARKKRWEFPLDGLPACRMLSDRIIIPLPIPPHVLRPNGQHGHWSVISKARKAGKAIAMLRTLQALNGCPAPCAVGYSLHYHFQSSIWDDDNAIASAKSYLDGISKAIGMDDRHLRFRELITAMDSKRPRLEIVMHLA